MKTRILISLLVLLILSAGKPASCYDLPGNASTELSSILLDKKFQPRGMQKSALRKNIEQRIEQFVERLKEMLSAGSEKIRDRESTSFWDLALQMLSDFSNWFLDSLVRLMEILLCVTSFCLIFLICHKLYKLTRKQDASPEKVFLASPRGQKQTDFNYQELIKSGDYLGALINFRKKLREELDSRHELAHSLTDREVLQRLKQTSPLLNTFERLAIIFEKAVYAGTQINQQAISKLVSDYEGRE